MTIDSLRIAAERPEDLAAIDSLNDEAFGPGRFARSAYRLRASAAPVPELNFTAWRDGELIGSIRYWRIELAGSRGLLLGPLVVRPRYKDKGCGLALMQHTLKLARDAGYPWVILVGDEPYYARVGFKRVPAGRITMPGPVDPDRLLYLELSNGALEPLSGRISGAAQ